MPLWLWWGKDGKNSAKTRSWDTVSKTAHKLEEDFELLSLGTEPHEKADPINFESPARLYLDDMAQQGIRDCSKARRMLFRLRDYANAQQIILLKDVSARLLTEWGSKWMFKVKLGAPRTLRDRFDPIIFSFFSNFHLDYFPGTVFNLGNRVPVLP